MGKLFSFVVPHTSYRCLINRPIPITFSPEEVHVETLPRLGKLFNQLISYRERERAMYEDDVLITVPILTQ